nr:chromosomal replication initiator protein DnaA [bacterium]
MGAMGAEALWNAILDRLKTELPALSFNTWFQETRAVTVMEQKLIVTVPHEYVRTNLLERWVPTIEAAMGEQGCAGMQVQFILESEKSLFAEQMQATSYEETGLMSQFLFDNFIVGDSNRLAHAAAKAVAEAPAQAYNPLFLYGGTGLGKTHLMHAIGNYIRRNNPALRILYVSSERFTNELVLAIQNARGRGDDANAAFRRKYRSVDVLLIDDIQFIAGRESTQSEIFHTFNDLHSHNKQIILSSDRPPKEIPRLEERLRSRFETGLIADIQPPDIDTRIAILQDKAARDNVRVAPEAVAFLAESCENNVRELEGTLTRVAAFARLTGRTIDLDLAREAMKGILPQRTRQEMTPDGILEAVAQAQDVTVEQIKSPTRSARVVMARQISMYLLRELTTLSLPRIGDLLGGRDHSTVLYGMDKVEKLMATNTNLRQQVYDLRRRITGE